MGAKSTIDMTREKILSKIGYFLYNASNRALCDVLEILNDDYYEKNKENGDYDEWLGLSNFFMVDEKSNTKEDIEEKDYY